MHKGIITSKNYKNYSFSCIPSSQKCEYLSVVNLKKDMIGSYHKKNHKSFEILGYESHLDFKFYSKKNNRTKYSSDTKSLYIQENELVEVICTVDIWTNSDYNLKLKTKIENCEDINELKEHAKDEYLDKIKLTSKCLKKFTRDNKNISCSFIDTNTEKPIEEFVVNLDIEYGPEYKNYYNHDSNINITFGSSLDLECPIVGYPIKYKWLSDRLIKSRLSTSCNTYTIPQNLAIGNYKIICQAEVIDNYGFKLKKLSSTFNLKVIKNKGKVQ